MGLQDVAFLPSRDNFSTTILKNCGRGESLRITTCLRTVVEGKQGHVPCKILLLHQSLFFVSVEFHGDHSIVIKLRSIWPPSILGILPDLRQWCLSIMTVCYSTILRKFGNFML